MKLYLLAQDENTGYDTYDSCVVAAENAEAARLISPCSYRGFSDSALHSWASSPDRVTVQFLGVAHDAQAPGIVLSSFNAG